MTSYLIAHFKISVVLIILFLFITRTGLVKSGRFKLIALYLILIKSLVPWGYLNFFKTPFREIFIGGGTSMDAVPVGMEEISSIDKVFFTGNLILIVWCIISILYLAFVLYGLVRLFRKVDTSYVCTDPEIEKIRCETILKYKKNFKILLSPETITPFIWWNRKWLVIIPESVLTLSTIEKSVILSHEFTHIRRFDFFKFLLLKFIKAVFFFSPLVNISVNEIFAAEEMETDREAMEHFDIGPVDFGNTLLNFIKISRQERYTVPTLIRPTNTKRNIKMRIEGLFRNKSSKRSKWLNRCFALIIFAVISLNFNSATAGKSVKKGEFINPLKSSRVTMGFGPVIHPIKKVEASHKGIDLAAPMNTKILSPKDGSVIKTDYDKIRGHYLILEHMNGYRTVYTHLSKISVAKGSMVKQGKEIGRVGNSGLSTGPHLHFEIHKNKVAVDPETLISFR